MAPKKMAHEPENMGIQRNLRRVHMLGFILPLGLVKNQHAVNPADVELKKDLQESLSLLLIPVHLI
jgi:hypothetical protein